MFSSQQQTQTPQSAYLYTFMPTCYQNNCFFPIYFSNQPLPKSETSNQNPQQKPLYVPENSTSMRADPMDNMAMGRAQEKSPSNIPPKKINKSQKILRNAKPDEQFKPYSIIQKKKRKAPQNVNRNVVPNIIHQIFSYLQKKSKSQALVQKMLQQESVPHQATVRRFYLYQNMIRDKMNHYVCTQSLQIFLEPQDEQCELYSLEEQSQYLKISRTLISLFLRRQFQTIILTSKRVNCQKKVNHLEYRRKILEETLQYFSK